MAATSPDFAKMVPGFDFLQGLVKTASSALPGIGQWVAPTLDPGEIEKRIDELRTVQFWLEQNARMLGTTIQALEVQRMTLSTLKTMNVQVGDLRDALTLKPAAAEPGPPARDEAAPEPAPAPAVAAVDPGQWWGALTQQFTQIAAQAVKDSAGDAARALAGQLVQQGFQAAEQTFKAGMAPARKAAEVAGAMAQRVQAARPSRHPAAAPTAPAAEPAPPRRPAATRAPARKAPARKA